MIIRELLTLFGFEVDEAGADAAEKRYATLKKAAGIVAITAAAATAALVLMIREAVNTGDEIQRAAKRTHTGAQEFQELAYGAQKTGADMGEFANGLRIMSQRAAEAHGKNKAFAKGFAAVGVSVTDAHGKVKPTAQLLGEVADGLLKIPDPAMRTAAAMRVFGRAGQALIPFLEQGSEGIAGMSEEARRLGFVLDGETVLQLKELGDTFVDIGLIFKGFRLELVKDMLPGLAEAAANFKELMIAMRPMLALHRLGQLIGELAKKMSELAIWAVRNRRFFAVLSAVLGAVLLAKVVGLADAFGILRLSFVKTALTLGFQFVAIGALIAIIAILIEDIATGSRGLRELRDYFLKEAQKPDANWMVKVIAGLLSGFVDVIDKTDEFFKMFFEDAEKMSGTWGALKNAGGIAIDYWITKLKEFKGILLWKSPEIKALAKEAPPNPDAAHGKHSTFHQTRLEAPANQSVEPTYVGPQSIDVTVNTGNVTDSAESIGDTVRGELKAFDRMLGHAMYEFVNGIVR